VERLVVAIETAVRDAGDGWEARLSEGLKGGLELLADDPALARRLLVEPLEAGDEVRLAHERSIGRLAEALRPPAELTGNQQLSDELLRLQAHGLVSYLSGRVLAGETEKLPEAHGALLEYLLAFSGSPD
jgi:hypothetical protein